jgi:hypothetical protein
MTSTPARDALADAARDIRGRFQPGQSGNPAGKKPGTLNHATRWRQRLAEGDEDGFADHIVGQARKGDFRAIRFVLEQIDPKPRGRAVPFEVDPKASVLDKFAALFKALSAGDITADEARTLALVIESEGRERARIVAVEEAVFRNRDKRTYNEFRQVVGQLDALYPLFKGAPKAGPAGAAGTADPTPDDLHPTCMSPAATSGAPGPVMPGADPGIMTAASAAAAPAVAMAGAGQSLGPAMTAGAAADLHSACISGPAASPPTPRGRAVDHLPATERAVAPDPA